MIRAAIILATIVAFVAGSLDIPVYLHSCRMMERETFDMSGCSMCEPDHRDVPVRVSIGTEDTRHTLTSVPCCTDHEIDRHLDPSLLGRPDLPVAPSLQAVPPSFIAGLHRAVAARVDTDWTDRPPPLAECGPATYLVNSVFLI